jgi:exopolyphosphatase/guanosine-5'-triphosphate,3'-diphosphate pyrophosphatase
MERVIHCLRDWRRLLDQLRPDAEIAVATSAVRDASNRADFLDQVRRETGFLIEVITGEEEARRTLLGICAGLPRGIDSFLGLDIGGGSTEFIVHRSGQTLQVQSVDVGVVRLTEMALRHDPILPADVQQARAIVRDHLAVVRRSLPGPGEIPLVGTAGSVTSLAAMALRLTTHEPARVHNFQLGLDVVKGFEAEFLRRTKAERRGLYGLEPGREDVIVAGTLILREIMEGLGYAECLVSDYGLREGVLIDLAMRTL